MSGKAWYGNSTQPVHNFSLHHYGIVTYTIIQVCQNAPYAQCNGRLFTLKAPFQNSTLRHLKLGSRTWQLLQLLSKPLIAGGIHSCVMYETQSLPTHLSSLQFVDCHILRSLLDNIVNAALSFLLPSFGCHSELPSALLVSAITTIVFYV